MSDEPYRRLGALVDGYGVRKDGRPGITGYAVVDGVAGSVMTSIDLDDAWEWCDRLRAAHRRGVEVEQCRIVAFIDELRMKARDGYKSEVDKWLFELAVRIFQDDPKPAAPPPGEDKPQRPAQAPQTCDHGNFGVCCQPARITTDGK